MSDTGVIDRFFDVFTRYIDSGFGLLGGEVAFLSTTLVAIDVTLAALFWAWASGEDVIARLVKKTLYVGFFAFLIGNFHSLTGIVLKSFSGLGLKASGAGVSAEDFLRPGKLAALGLSACKPILQAASDLGGFPGFFENIVQIVILLAVALLVIVAFFVIAVQIFVVLIEFKLTTLAGFVLVPFGLFGRTAFLAEKVLGNVIASGVKVMVLAVIVGIGSSLFSEFTSAASGQPALGERWWCASRRIAARAPRGEAPFTKNAAMTKRPPLNLEAGRLTRSSSRAEAQPKASWRGERWPIMLWT